MNLVQIKVLVGLLLACLALECRADDASTGVKSPVFAMDATGQGNVRNVSVSIVGSDVTVAMDVDIRQGDQRRATVLMPKFSWMGQAETYPNRHYPEFKLSFNGKPAEWQDGFEASVGSTDVSAMIRAAGLDPYVIADNDPPFVEPVDGKSLAFADLEKATAIRQVDSHALANWSVRRIIHTELPVGNSRVSWQYKSLPAYKLISMKALLSMKTLPRYCITSSGPKVSLGKKIRSQYVVEEHTLTFDGLKDFPITVIMGTDSKTNKDALMFACSADGSVISTDNSLQASALVSKDGEFRWLVLAPAN